MHRLLLAWTWTRRGIIDPSLMKGNRHPPQFRRLLQLVGDDIQTAILDYPFVHSFRLTPPTPLRPTFPLPLPTLRALLFSRSCLLLPLSLQKRALAAR